MKFIKKSLAASVVSAALVAAGPAMAAIDGDNLPLGANQFTFSGGTGEIFASVVARGANPANDMSIVIDTGILASSMVSALNGGTLGSLFHSIAPDANMQQFLLDAASNNQTLSFNVMAVHNPDNSDGNFDVEDVGMLTTSAVDAASITAAAPGNIQDFGTSGGSGRVNNIVRNANIATDGSPTGNVALNLSSVHDTSSLAFHDNTIGTNAVFGFDTEGGVSSLVDFYFLEMTQFSGNDAPALLGTWELLTDGTLQFNGAAPIPVPAAVWLMGSALVGLAGVKRRKQS
jgi:hypothetical protein